MQTPFVFGRLARGNNFTNRDNEVERLLFNFKSGVNTIMISPRRWGKSSLVLHTSEKLDKSSTKVVLIDMFNIRSEEEFYRVLAEKVMQSVSNKLDD